MEDETKSEKVTVRELGTVSEPGEVASSSSSPSLTKSLIADNSSGPALVKLSGSDDNSSSEQKSASKESSSSGTEEEATKVSSSSGKTPKDGVLPKKPKKDRSNLRKGKWTVEEEEYTSRIIHYFGTGLLTLPEGATLRSYLADKLNCDPMRITKKYAGASCLGRRVHQFRDRPTPTIAQIQLARAELDHLEQRFRMRVEEGYSSPPLPPAADMLFSLSQQANQFMTNQPAAPVAPPPPPPQVNNNNNAIPSWLLAMIQQQQQQQPTQAPTPAPVVPQQSSNLFSDHAKTLSGLASLQAALPWLMPNIGANISQQQPSQSSQGMSSNVDASIASWAFAQAAASLAPAITQLAAATLQQQQQRNFQQSQPPAAPASDPMKEFSARLQESRDANALRQALEAAMAGKMFAGSQPQQQQSQPPQAMHSPVGYARPQHQQYQKAAPTLKRKDSPGVLAPRMPTAVAPKPSGSHGGTKGRPRTDEDKQAGNILLGFLSSLRQSYEEALKEKEQGGTSSSRNQQSTFPPQHHMTSLQEAVHRMNPQRKHQRSIPQVSDISSGISSSTDQPESSLEESDWNSDKNKTETSSSEDSDKEVKGPPRKRLKTKRAADERKRVSAKTNKD